MRKGRLEELSLHPTVKPVALVADAILDVTNRNDIVLDPFSGSGTTIIAAEKTGRKAYVIELDPAYVDVAIKRFETLYGVEAIHAESGKSFATVRQERLCKDKSLTETSVKRRQRYVSTPTESSNNATAQASDRNTSCL